MTGASAKSLLRKGFESSARALEFLTSLLFTPLSLHSGTSLADTILLFDSAVKSLVFSTGSIFPSSQISSSSVPVVLGRLQPDSSHLFFAIKTLFRKSINSFKAESRNLVSSTSTLIRTEIHCWTETKCLVTNNLYSSLNMSNTTLFSLFS
uniref:Uncharacterized protein n=1 Tax=Opuntia streptacantha TaxID=393608 RepID=A0A7C9E392_OPUST